MHWPVPVEAMRSVIPTSLELDLYNGEAYVGIVPFMMEGVRPRWWPESLSFRFLETNVRAYVLCGEKPGVYFLSLEAASQLAVWCARSVWGLPYHHAQMRLERDGDDIRYRTKRTRTNVSHNVHYRLGNSLGPSQPGSLEFFFLERYLLFVERNHQLFAGQVYHSPYPAQRAEVLSVDDELVPAAGLPQLAGPPTFAHYASGVDVEIFELTPVSHK
jgi:uncharacterized protein YqjF (DUF2071 family)